MGMHNRETVALRTLRDVLASRTQTRAEDWYPVFKARYGMQVAFRVLGDVYGDGDVLTQLYTCCTTVDAIVAARMTPRYADVSGATLALDPAGIDVDERTRAVIAQHTCGIIDPRADAELARVAHEAGAILVEDNAHCVARLSRGEDGAPLADVSIHSFGVEKVLPDTYFGGAVWLNPNMADVALRGQIAQALRNLPELPARLDRAARLYRNEVRVLTRMPSAAATPVRGALERLGAFEPAVSREELVAELPLEAYAPSEWVAGRATAALAALDDNEARRRTCVEVYLDVFGRALARGRLPQGMLPDDLELLHGQPLLRFPVTLQTPPLAELARKKVAELGFYAVPWYRPLLFPGVADPQAYGWDGEAGAYPECERLSRGALALPTDIDREGARAVAEAVAALASPEAPAEVPAPVLGPANLVLVHDEQDVHDRLVPVIVGGDLLAYAYVREFHAAYGIRPIVLSSIDVKITSSSALCDYRVVPGMDDDAKVIEYLDALGRDLAARGKVGLALGLADRQTRLLSEHKAELSRWYVVPYVDVDLLDDITRKDRFYALCEELGIAYPKTWELDCGPDHGPLDASAFPYPLVAKPAHSASWDATDFPGKRKIYELSSPQELEEAYAAICDSAYDGKLIVQDFVPGDDDAIRSLTTFSDSKGDLRVVAGGRVALQDHSPLALGNPVCILSEKVDRIVEDASKFLSHVGYRGYANFDIKYDVRDGSYRFFEVNARPGRNTFYVSQGGVSFVRPIVDEFVLGREVPYAEAYAPYLYTIVPPVVARRSIANEALRDDVLACYKDGRAGNPLEYAADAPAHKLWARLYTQNQVRKFKRYLWDA